MGRKWDGNKGGRDLWIAWLAERMREARRVIKPGHYALVWSIPRSSHWTGMALEDAGWIICERIAHVHGQGFPKGKNKLKPAVEDWWLIRAPGPASALHIDACRVGTNGEQPGGSGNRASWRVMEGRSDIPPAPGNTTPASGRWPANLILQHGNCIPNGVKRVRGPKDSTHYASIGYGGSDVTFTTRGYADADGRETVASFICEPGCPVRELGEMSGELTSGAFRNTVQAARQNISKGGEGERARGDRAADTGTAARFFPNLDPPEWVCSPDCAIRQLDEQSGERPGATSNSNGSTTWFANGERSDTADGYNDTGGASRYYPNLDPPFFYAAKASRRERGAGCDGLYWLADDTRGSGYRPITREEYEAAQEAGERVARGNMHPTVKSLKLLSWLINLLTVPGDTILDPFAGSGSIGVAAVQGGRGFVGVEMDLDYMSICEQRLAEALAQPRQMEIDV